MWPVKVMDLTHSPHEIVVYTDGSCLGNPGPGGAGIVMIFGKYRKELGCFLGDVTNNIAELMAIKIALEKIKKRNLPVYVYTDSTYAVGVLNRRYKARKNVDLVHSICNLCNEFNSLKILKVSGHSGVEENERADYLASQAAIQRKDTLDPDYS